MGKHTFAVFILIIFSMIVGIATLLFVYNSSLRAATVKPTVTFEAKGSAEEKLLKQEENRKKEVNETIANYKKRFGKDFVAVLAQEIKEFKEERGIDEFREKFGDGLQEYEFYTEKDKLADSSESKQEDPGDAYSNAFDTSVLDLEIFQ